MVEEAHGNGAQRANETRERRREQPVSESEDIHQPKDHPRNNRAAVGFGAHVSEVYRMMWYIMIVGAEMCFLAAQI